MLQTAALAIIDPNQISRRLPKGYTLDYVENYLANKILYPKTLPLTKKTFTLEAAILQELFVKKADK